jgi:hypothetical protein
VTTALLQTQKAVSSANGSRHVHDESHSLLQRAAEPRSLSTAYQGL